VGPEIERLREYLDILAALGLEPYVEVDLKIVRGLAYYTGIVFELFDRKGELRAICGGGRYDRLLELVGGEPLPAVGFGMGDVVLGELLGGPRPAPGHIQEARLLRRAGEPRTAERCLEDRPGSAKAGVTAWPTRCAIRVSGSR
jgi:ATP phosphoribosyltransferase regulatory subunit HisZ